MQCSPICSKTDGMEVARCGSLDNNALPVVVRDPETAQEFDPTPRSAPPSPTSWGMAAIRSAACRSAREALTDLDPVTGAGRAEPAAASGRKVPPLTEPWATIGRA